MISILKIQHSLEIYRRSYDFSNEIAKRRDKMAASETVFKEGNAIDIINNLEKKLKHKNELTKSIFDRLRGEFKHTDTATPSDIIETLSSYSEDEKFRGYDGYYGELARNGVKRAEGFNSFNPKRSNYIEFINQLENPDKNTFVSFESENHAMSVSIIKKGSGYQWSFLNLIMVVLHLTIIKILKVSWIILQKIEIVMLNQAIVLKLTIIYLL